MTTLNAAKTKAREMLLSLSNCPAHTIHNCEFNNGIQRPNNQPPQTVYLEHDGSKYRLSKNTMRWERV